MESAAGKRRLSKKERKDRKKRDPAPTDGGGTAIPSRSSADEPRKKKRKKKHPVASSTLSVTGSTSKGTARTVYQDFMLLDDGLDTPTKLFELANIPVVGYRCTTKAMRTGQPKTEGKGGTRGGGEEDTVVWIRQDPSVVECTGGVLWETAFLLSSFLLNDEEHSPILLGQAAGAGAGAGAAAAGGSVPVPTVLELGAGCGLVGLASAEAGCTVCTTEAPPAMDNLRYNVQANMGLVDASGGQVSAVPLSWGSAADAAAVRKGHGAATFDLIVGTDVVFNVELVAPLLATMREFSHVGTKTLLCLQERCAAAHKELLATAPDHFEVRDLSSRLPLLEGCAYAQELECHLFEFTLKRPKAF